MFSISDLFNMTVDSGTTSSQAHGGKCHVAVRLIIKSMFQPEVHCD